MNILFFSYTFSPDIGGIESISSMLAAYFFEHGHEVRLITSTQNTNPSLFPYKIINAPGTRAIINELKWAGIVFENNPCFSLSYPNFLLRKPTVIGLQTWLQELDGTVGLRQNAKKLMLTSASKVIACSRAVQQTFKKAIVIPNPYNDVLFKYNPLIQKTRDFIFLGRLVSDKGPGLAIQAYAEVVKAHPAVSLTIVGSGEDLPALTALANELGLRHKIEFKGALEGEPLVNCLNEHKYLLVPSIWKEPFGIVALEGMACGCIPVVSDGGGLPEAIGGYGLIFERGNAAALTKAMLQLLEKTPQIDVAGTGAQQHLKAHSVEAIARQYLSVFESVANA